MSSSWKNGGGKTYFDTTINWQWATAASTKSADSSEKPAYTKWCQWKNVKGYHGQLEKWMAMELLHALKIGILLLYIIIVKTLGKEGNELFRLKSSWPYILLDFATLYQPSSPEISGNTTRMSDKQNSIPCTNFWHQYSEWGIYDDIKY